MSFWSHKSTKKVLSQQHPLDHHRFPGLRTFPTGKVKENETLIETLFRETKEELDIIPQTYIQLLPDGEFLFDNPEIHLFPFLITRWQGSIPDKILDNDTPLVWETLEEAANSPITTRKPFVELVKQSLQGQHFIPTKNRLKKRSFD